MRQERIGLHMADAMSRLTKGRKMGVFCMQSGPGAENAYGGVAQAFGESVPLLVIPQGYPRRIAHVPPNFNSTLAMAHVAKHAEPITNGREIVNIMRRAFSLLRNGRGAPVIVELPADAYGEDAPDPLNYEPVIVTKYGPDPGGGARGGQGADGRQAAGDLCRPGRALGRGLCRAEGAGRASGHPGLHQPRGQEQLRRDPSAGARLGRPRLSEGGAGASSTGPT